MTRGEDDKLLLPNGRAVSGHAVDLLTDLYRQGVTMRAVGDRVLVDRMRALHPDIRWSIESRAPDLLAMLQAEPTGAVH